MATATDVPVQHSWLNSIGVLVPSSLTGLHFGIGVPESVQREFEILKHRAQELMQVIYGGGAATDPDKAKHLVELTDDKDRFRVSLNVCHFKPEEITVKVTSDNTLEIQGEHDDRRDEHGFISRRFIRKYSLPKDAKAEKVTCHLSPFGILIVEAPKQAVPIEAETTRNIPIQSVHCEL